MSDDAPSALPISPVVPVVSSDASIRCVALSQDRASTFVALYANHVKSFAVIKLKADLIRSI